jgi:8-oxo-dGTP pyrophosphatase MutT (NUDIX family)
MSSEAGESPPALSANSREFSAGGVVLRDGQVALIVPVKRGAGGVRVLGLPKGHPDGEETPIEAATREVREETGLTAELIEPLGEVQYEYERKGRLMNKTVAFFLYRYLSGSLDDHDDEIEEAMWMPLEDALAAVTYPGEREILRRALSRGAA